ncbi:hypothetical protein D3C73_852360 [compost metagenome]
MPVARPGPAPTPVRRVDADHHSVAGGCGVVATQGLRLGRSQPYDPDGRTARRISPLVLPPQSVDRVAVFTVVSGGEPVRTRRFDLAAAVRLPGRALQPSTVVAVHPRRRRPPWPAFAAWRRCAVDDRFTDLAAAHRAPDHPPADARRTGTCAQNPHGLGPTGRRPGPDR